MPDAREIVAAYLRDKAENDKPAAQRELVGQRTREIIDELPDGFTARDVRACVKALTEGEPLLTDMKDTNRNAVVRRVLADDVADGELKLEGTLYSHKAIT